MNADGHIACALQETIVANPKVKKNDTKPKLIVANPTVKPIVGSMAQLVLFRVTRILDIGQVTD